LLAHGQWFSPGTPASFTTKTGHAEILLKVVLNTKNQINLLLWLHDIATSGFWIYNYTLL
jgi:hypothetical protein